MSPTRSDRIAQVLAKSANAPKVCTCGNPLTCRRIDFLRRKGVPESSPAWKTCDLCAMGAPR